MWCVYVRGMYILSRPRTCVRCCRWPGACSCAVLCRTLSRDKAACSSCAMHVASCTAASPPVAACSLPAPWPALASRTASCLSWRKHERGKRKKKRNMSCADRRRCCCAALWGALRGAVLCCDITHIRSTYTYTHPQLDCARPPHSLRRLTALQQASQASQPASSARAALPCPAAGGLGCRCDGRGPGVGRRGVCGRGRGRVFCNTHIPYLAAGRQAGVSRYRVPAPPGRPPLGARASHAALPCTSPYCLPRRYLHLPIDGWLLTFHVPCHMLAHAHSRSHPRRPPLLLLFRPPPPPKRHNPGSCQCARKRGVPPPPACHALPRRAIDPNLAWVPYLFPTSVRSPYLFDLHLECGPSGSRSHTPPPSPSPPSPPLSAWLLASSPFPIDRPA